MSRRATGFFTKFVRNTFLDQPAAWGVAAVGAGAWLYYDGSRTKPAESFDAAEQKKWNDKVLAKQRAKKADDVMYGRKPAADDLPQTSAAAARK